jgi:hypothetical protein
LRAAPFEALWSVLSFRGDEAGGLFWEFINAVTVQHSSLQLVTRTEIPGVDRFSTCVSFILTVVIADAFFTQLPA